MKYETRNHLGLGALIGGGLATCFAILFTSGTMLVILLVVGLPLIVAGGYMMTRSFTDADKDHPDYEDFQRRRREHDERMANRKFDT